ncbi:MAG: pyridoxal phosphate-dependent aminotransferase [Proteobacteria bacterium]|nr:pyridoxal phosphate-dependent aminotransferase [Pseudomonadota bacterium]
MKNLSSVVENLGDSAVSTIISKAAAAGWKDTLHLAGGEPNFPLFPGLIEKLVNFNKNMITKYSPFLGYENLLNLIQLKLKLLNRIDTPLEEIIVVPGGSSALFSSLSVVLNQGEEVLISNPCWEHYEKIIKLAGGISKSFNLKYLNNRYEIDFQHLKHNITDKTKVILLNTPLNPLGSVLSISEIKELIDICEKHNLWLIVDEEYETFVYDNNQHISIRSLYDQAITLFSFSKSFALTGIRLGYITAPKKIITLLKRFGLYTYMFSSSPSQCIAISLLEDGSYVDYLLDVKKLYQDKMDFFFNLIKDIPNITCWRPEGGVYLFPQLKTHENNPADVLINKYHLLCVPGYVAGSCGNNHVRFFLGAEKEILSSAAERLKTFMNENVSN